MPRVQTIVPNFQNGASMVPDARGLGMGLGQMFSDMRQRKIDEQKKGEFSKANDIYSFTGSLIQMPDEQRSQMLIEKAQYFSDMGDEENAAESLRLAEMTPELRQQEIYQDFINSSNILGRDPYDALNRMGLMGGSESELPSDVRETLWFNKQTPEVQEQHLKLKRRAQTDYGAMLDYQDKLAKIKADQKGQEVIAEAEATAQVLPSITESRAKEAAAVERAKSGQKGSQEAFKKGQALGAQLDRIDKAINALDKGAKSGVIQNRLPSFTQATTQLEEAAKELGIEVINSATFGALSAPELKLALDTALPMNLDEGDLRQYLSDKRYAMKKLQGEIFRLGKHLEKGGSMSEWIDMQPKEEDNLSDEQLLDMY